MTDTPALPPTYPRPNLLEQIKTVVGDLARPFAIYATAAGEAYAIFVGKDAGVIAAGGTVLAALYASKTIENQQAGSQAAKVAIAKAENQPTPAPVIGDGELPPAQRVP